MRIRIGNVKNGDEGVYIGRKMPGRDASPLGNPFRVGSHEAPGATLDRYLAWLRRQYADQGDVYDEMHRLLDLARSGEEVVLVCWCHPLPCHGDVVRDALIRLDEAT